MSTFQDRLGTIIENALKKRGAFLCFVPQDGMQSALTAVDVSAMTGDITGAQSQVIYMILISIA
eukprot:COSAG06_NODE_15794_length_1043_cov_1.816737_1_plen_64_part_00